MHIARRLFHALSGCLIVAVSFGLETKQEFAGALGFLTLICLVLEALRLNSPAFNKVVLKILGPLARTGEEDRLSGIAYYLLGCLVASVVFPRQIAVMSILFLALGDPIASAVGVLVGRRRWPSEISPNRKTFEGSLSCFLVCGLVCFGFSYFFSRTLALELPDRILFGVIGGLAAALGELLPLRPDDNFAMPLISGTCLWVIAAFFNLMPGLYF